MWCEEKSKVIECFTSYFQALFQTNGQKEWRSVLDDVPLLVSWEMNAELTKEVIDE